MSERHNFRAFVEKYHQPEPVMVTRPALPPREEYDKLLDGIWQRQWLTNDGEMHKQLEAELVRFLGVDHLSLFNNGATALLVMLQALRINGGEVITTPFTFPATTHVLHWNRVKPVFCDIEPKTFNIDADRIERLIGPETRAILAVHVYGNPCDVDALQTIADRHGLHVIYDAAHAFNVTKDGKSILSWGDMSMLSFHATKVFSTVEGGALIMQNEAVRKRVNSLKNFGIANENEIIGPGINGKMNELQAAFGRLTLKTVREQIQSRRAIAETYRKELDGLEGVTFLRDLAGVESNYGYFPILIDAQKYGLSRDEVYAALREMNIFSRKYFYPLVSHAACYSALPSALPGQMPVAERVATEVLCLPIYGSLPVSTAKTISEILRKLPAQARGLDRMDHSAVIQ